MITEDYVSFEIAKLLKEKGFDDNCAALYDLRSGEISQRGVGYVFNNGQWNNFITAPTLQMTMKWLREIKGLNIYARGVWKDVEVQYGDWEPAVVGYEWFVESLTDDTYLKMSVEQFLTYEEACEAAIKYCLENLI